MRIALLLLPLLHNQTVTPPLITSHLHLRRLANRPHRLRSHVAKQAFRMTHEIGSVARVAFAEGLCAVLLVRAGDELGGQGG